jgi:ASCH domain
LRYLHVLDHLDACLGSVRQPYAELILTGEKQIEYRSRRTNIRERVFIYASKTPGDPDDFDDLGLQPGDLPTGVLVGSIEISECSGGDGDFEWHLSKPERFSRLRPPKNRAQPVFFFPF